MNKPSAAGLTMQCHIVHNIVGHCILPRGGHRDEVSYFEAFVIDSMVVRRRLHLGHMIIQHMIANCRKMGCILPYGHLLTKVFQAFGIDLNIEPDVERPKSTDIIKSIILARMRIFKDKNGRWVAGGDDEKILMKMMVTGDKGEKT